MEWYSIVEGIIILGAIIVVGVIQNRTIKAQEKELKAVRTFMEIFDVQKVKDYVDLSTETLTKKAKKSESELAKIADELKDKSWQLDMSYENMERAFGVIGKFATHMVELCSTMIEHFQYEEEVFQLPEGEKKITATQNLGRLAKNNIKRLNTIKTNSQEIVDDEKNAAEKSSSEVNSSNDKKKI